MGSVGRGKSTHHNSAVVPTRQQNCVQHPKFVGFFCFSGDSRASSKGFSSWAVGF